MIHLVRLRKCDLVSGNHQSFKFPSESNCRPKSSKPTISNWNFIHVEKIFVFWTHTMCDFVTDYLSNWSIVHVIRSFFWQKWPLKYSGWKFCINIGRIMFFLSLKNLNFTRLILTILTNTILQCRIKCICHGWRCMGYPISFVNWFVQLMKHGFCSKLIQTQSVQ